MQYFYINQNSILPSLRLELINDGKYEFLKTDSFNNAIQNADVKFTMYNEKGRMVISDEDCSLVLSELDGCVDNYIIEYKWKKRDTKEKGQFRGKFTINFRNDIKEEGVTYPNGNLIMPIYEDLTIFIK